jgi:hypothetical protein
MSLDYLGLQMRAQVDPAPSRVRHYRPASSWRDEGEPLSPDDSGKGQILASVSAEEASTALLLPKEHFV